MTARERATIESWLASPTPPPVLQEKWRGLNHDRRLVLLVCAKSLLDSQREHARRRTRAATTKTTRKEKRNG